MVNTKIDLNMSNTYFDWYHLFLSKFELLKNGLLQIMTSYSS